MKQKGFAPIIILVLITLAVTGYFGYKNYWPKPQTLTTPTPIADQAPNGNLANWKTYTNQEFGFSIKYPSDYSLHDDGPNEVEQQKEKGQQISGTQPAILDTITFSNLAKNQFSISIFPKTPNADINNVYEFSGICGTQFADKTISNQISQLGNIQYKRVQQSLPDKKVMTDICLYNFNGNLITLRSSDSSTSNLLDQILSTFKFLNQEEIPAITNEELSRGWYWGSSSQKKPGTPSDWVHSDEGTRNASWHKPGITTTFAPD